MAYSGYFRPKNTNKYKGDYRNIVYRSLWEKNCMMFFDKSPDVVQWSSEEITIPYYDEGDKRVHRYFPDFWVKWKNGKQTLIEVKPQKETVPPTSQKRTKRYINEAFTYIKNTCKWQAAEEYCKDHKMQFDIWTEVKLGKMGILPKKMPGKLKPLKKMKPYSRKKTK